MFKFDWAEFAEGPVLGVLADLSGIDDLGSAQPAVARSVAAILSAVGGLPVCERSLDEAEQATVAEMLLSEAMDRYFAIAGIRRNETGYLLGSADPGHFDHEIVHTLLVDINSATAQQLIDLPVFGERLAEAIIDERTRHGAFASWDDLAARVEGVGLGAAAILGTAVTFAAPGMSGMSVPAPDASFAVRFGALLDRFPAGSRTAILLRALDSLAVTVASDPHPSTVLQQRRLDLEREPLALQEVGWLGVLADRDYYRRLPGLLATADDSISVAMFHVALPNDAHPTRDLLDELVRAHERGTSVRVLLDRDRPTDPYQSTAINTPAKTYLADRGVPVRFDDEEVLLHSKFVVIDRRLCVMGSHNWSAGSFFHFDDVSVVIGSDALGAELGDRFDAMWAG